MSTITNKTQVPMVKTADGITFVGPQGRSYTLHKDTPGYDELVQKIREGADGQTLVDFLERDVKRLRDAAKALGDDVAPLSERRESAQRDWPLRDNNEERSLRHFTRFRIMAHAVFSIGTFRFSLGSPF